MRLRRRREEEKRNDVKKEEKIEIIRHEIETVTISDDEDGKTTSILRVLS